MLPAYSGWARHIISNAEKKGLKMSSPEQAVVFQIARSECENDYKFYSSKLARYMISSCRVFEWDREGPLKYNLPSYDEATSNLSDAANNWLGNASSLFISLGGLRTIHDQGRRAFLPRQTRSNRSNLLRHSALFPHQELDPAMKKKHITGGALDGVLITLYKQKLANLMALTKTLHIVPCLDGQYITPCLAHRQSRRERVHVRIWQDEEFPCVHAVKAAIHHGMHVTELLTLISSRRSPLPRRTTINSSQLSDRQQSLRTPPYAFPRS
ncbi:hypothetical protein GQ600_15180 [Phytophthora cactorum]|nr:hypothetical protein GQ600_15180 [Phytophthora cactorum]